MGAAGPVSGQRCVQETAESLCVDGGGVLNVGTDQRSVHSDTGDLDRPSAAPHELSGGQAQVVQPTIVGRGDGFGGFGDQTCGPFGFHGSLGEQVGQGGADHPLLDDVGGGCGVVGVEDLGDACIGDAAGGACCVHDFGGAGEAFGEGPDGDGTCQGLVGGLPAGGSTGLARDLVEAVPVGQLCPGFDQEGAHSGSDGRQCHVAARAVCDITLHRRG